MPITDFGVSFNPSATAQQGQGQPGAPGRLRNPVQEAVQTLNVRLPKVFGARAPSPPALLTGAGGMGQWGGGGNLIAQVLAALAGIAPPQAPPMSDRGGLRRPNMLQPMGSGASAPSGGGYSGAAMPAPAPTAWPSQPALTAPLPVSVTYPFNPPSSASPMPMPMPSAPEPAPQAPAPAPAPYPSSPYDPAQNIWE